MTLDASTLDAIFGRLAVVYGSRFTSQWPVAALAEVKAGWGRELREFASNPDAIDYALEHLPSGMPPMVLDFRDLARTHVAATRATLQSKQAPVSDEDRQFALSVLRSFRRPDRVAFKAWAKRLRFRELAGERLTRFQRLAWREALGSSHNESTSTYDERG